MMKNKLLFFYCICFCFLFSNKIFSQERNEEKETKEHMHQLTLIISRSHVTDGVNESGDSKWIVVPSWGFDYNYWIADHWANTTSCDNVNFQTTYPKSCV